MPKPALWFAIQCSEEQRTRGKLCADQRERLSLILVLSHVGRELLASHLLAALFSGIGTSLTPGAVIVASTWCHAIANIGALARAALPHGKILLWQKRMPHE